MISVKNKAASFLHTLTAGQAFLNAGITGLDSIKEEAAKAGLPADALDLIEKDLAAYSTRVEAAMKAKLVLHERISRYLGDDQLKVGT